VIVDFSLGQFTGMASPGISPDKAAFTQKLPSGVLKCTGVRSAK